MPPPTIRWPGGAPFAFTICDDTDRSTTENAPPVYALLTQLGMRTTKLVWPVAGTDRPRVLGSTCADPAYLAWLRTIAADGHEIGLHNVTNQPSLRGETIAGIDAFRELFGHDPRVGADHSGNTEALYSGARRLSGLRARVYGPVNRVMYHGLEPSSGDQTDSAYFWGDICRERLDYWRSFTFPATNALDPCPRLPYHDPDRHWVAQWFTATHTPIMGDLLAAITPERLDALEAASGVAILATHLGADAADHGEIDPRLAPALRAVADRKPWCAPVSEILDHLRAERGDHVLDDRARARLERRWLVDQTRSRAGHELRKVLSGRPPGPGPIP